MAIKKPLVLSAAGEIEQLQLGDTLEGTSNDVEITDATKGVILKSANGTRYRITVDNDGSLITTEVV